METWDAIRSRRNVRDYLDRPIAPEHLDRILEAGWRSPSSRNEQPWDFVAVTDRARLRDLSKVWRGAGHVATSAATVALIAPESDTPEHAASIRFDLGQATMSMMLAAADLGIGTCHSAVADQDLARRILGHPEGRRCAHLVSFGHPADRPLRPIARPDRRPIDQVVHRGGW
jgi:nitroreductase